MLNLLIVSFIVLGAFFGQRVNLLNRGGAISAAFVGVAVLYGFGLKGLIVLGVFFLTSSAWSSFRKGQKKCIGDKLAKTSKRDTSQVIANGGVITIISILAIIFPSTLLLVAFLVGLAAANADTWASEIGPLSKQKPFHILRWVKVDAGTSGAITVFGTFASLLGSLLIGLLGILLWDSLALHDLVLISLLGLFGSFLDTFLGATLQVSYTCTVCNIETEKLEHCRNKTVKEKGVDFINNEVVNFLAILVPVIVSLYYGFIKV